MTANSAIQIVGPGGGLAFIKNRLSNIDRHRPRDNSAASHNLHFGPAPREHHVDQWDFLAGDSDPLLASETVTVLPLNRLVFSAEYLSHPRLGQQPIQLT